jgi:hypothetical protein
VLVITALRQGRNQGYTIERLTSLFGVTRPTLQRWRKYFREVFPCSHSWKSLSGRIMPPVEVEQLPGSILERFIQIRGTPEGGLTFCLRALLLGHDS